MNIVLMYMKKNWYYWTGKYIGHDISGTSYDAAHEEWGGGARMPTHDEVCELIEKCTIEYAELNGVKGRFFTGPNGNTIFIPHRTNYWTSTLLDGSAYAWAYYFNIGLLSVPCEMRCGGKLIRPVKSK